MATAKTPAAKKAPLAKKAGNTVAAPKTYSMPLEVKNWIEQAHSTINH